MMIIELISDHSLRGPVSSMLFGCNVECQLLTVPDKGLSPLNLHFPTRETSEFSSP